MKPGDHPEFFRVQPPPGTSRESTIRLDRHGTFWQGDDPINDPPALVDAFHRWISRHPDDHRYILTNGYDWTYFAVEDVPFIVRAVKAESDHLSLRLSDGTVVPFPPHDLTEGDDQALYVPVMVRGQTFEARFSQQAQNDLAPWLIETPDGVGIRVGEHVLVPRPRSAQAAS